MRILILAATPMPHGELSTSPLSSRVLHPFKGKPVIFEMQERFAEKQIYLITGKSNNDYLKQIIGEFSNIECIELDTNQIQHGPGKTLIAAIEELEESDEPFVVIFADTLSSTAFQFAMHVDLHIPSDECIVFGSPYIPSLKYSHFAVSNNLVEHFIQKGSSIAYSNQIYTEIGIYIFPNNRSIKEKIRNQELSKINSMSDVISIFKTRKFIKVEDWIDLGHTDFIDFKHNLQSRHFNHLNLENGNQQVIKTSTNKNKIVEEIDFYLNLPDQIKPYFPRVFEHDKRNGRYSIEFWPLRPLSELIIFWNLDEITCLRICAGLDNYLRDCESVVSVRHKEIFSLVNENFPNFLHSKSKKIERELHSNLREILDRNVIMINGQKYPGYRHISLRIEKLLQEMYGNLKPIFSHGDLVFSNILYSPEADVLKLIDPRGSFGETRYFTDYRYDYAKLFQCLYGKYDFIKADLFSLSEENGNFEFEVFVSAGAQESLRVLRSKLIEEKITDREKELIAGMTIHHLLTLLQHHSDEPKQQVAFILSACQLYSKFLA